MPPVDSDSIGLRCDQNSRKKDFLDAPRKRTRLCAMNIKNLHLVGIALICAQTSSLAGIIDPILEKQKGPPPVSDTEQRLKSIEREIEFQKQEKALQKNEIDSLRKKSEFPWGALATIAAGLLAGFMTLQQVRRNALAAARTGNATNLRTLLGEYLALLFYVKNLGNAWRADSKNTEVADKFSEGLRDMNSTATQIRLHLNFRQASDNDLSLVMNEAEKAMDEIHKRDVSNDLRQLEEKYMECSRAILDELWNKLEKKIFASITEKLWQRNPKKSK